MRVSIAMRRFSAPPCDAIEPKKVDSIHFRNRSTNRSYGRHRRSQVPNATAKRQALDNAPLTDTRTNTNIAMKSGQEHYNELTKQILKNSALGSLCLCSYLSATISLKAGFTCALGSVGSGVYLLMLTKEIDQINSEDQIPIKRVEKMPDGFGKSIARVVAHYQQALRPRLLVLVSLAALVKCTGFVIEGGFSTLEEASMVIGFLSYKIPLLLLLYESLKPEEDIENSKPKRPSLYNEDEEEEFERFDLYGRKQLEVDAKIKDVKY